MAIQVSGVNVIDNERNLNVGVLTATTLDVPPQAITFSPTDNSSDVSLTSNIVITFNVDVQKGSGNITLREGSASGTVIETIAVSSGSVSISGGQVTINPSDFSTGKNIYVVVDDGAFESSALGAGTNLIDTYNFTTGPITTSSFSPTDGATNQEVDTNIVITFSENIAKGTGNILINSGSAGGTTLQTIDVTSGAVSVSGTQVTINPPSDLAFETDQYIVIPAGAFTNTDGDAASGNALINTYNFTTKSAFTPPPLGSSTEGGYLICNASNNMWIVAPSSTQVRRVWDCRNDTLLYTASAGCPGWFVPSRSQLMSPGYTCRTHWDDYDCGPHYLHGLYWSNTECDTPRAWAVQFNFNNSPQAYKASNFRVRAFRCVTY